MSSSPQKFSDPANGTVKNVTGLPTDGVNPHDKHPTWYRPEGKPLTDLRVLNSLTETTEPFVAIGGRVVKWYTCGPTVYDMSHMGHARAYLTFDILRRIMEDYFGYSIEYQMNITDIDDKIIKRARVNKLVADFTAEAAKRSFDEVRADVTVALDAQKASIEKRAAALAVPLPDTATGRDREERADNLKVLELRKEQHAEARARAAAAEKEKNASALIAAASAPLGDWLDSEKGSTITDHEIFNAHARRYEAEYFEDMRRLGVRDPDVISRVTEVVPQVVSFTQKIIDNGFAYVGESSVFFDTEAFTAAGHKYPKNHPTNQTEKNATTADEMAEGEGTLSSTKAGEKKSANDFALWKFSKPGEPAWPSPWGPGRPGWHIECSVMASEVLGDNMDIHGGGCDLKFPHHDNELAQSEAFWGHHQWVNYFFHCGHLHIAGLKMSKSLKNFITIRQALEMMSARQMRILFLQNSWHSSMNFSDQSVGVAKEFERQLRNFFGRVGMLTRENHLLQEQGFIGQDAELNRNITKTDKEIHDALCDNFDTPRVMAAIGKLMESATQYLDSKQRASTTLVKKAALLITKTLKVFGVIGGFDDIGITSEGSADGNSARADKIVDALVAYREDIRNAFRTKTLDQVMALSDKVRDELLPPLGIRLEDKPNAPTTWKNDDPQVLMRELEEKKAALAAAKRQKIVNELEKQERNLAKWEDYVAPPEAYFATSKAFAGKTLTFDEKGIPSSVDGQPVDAKVAKKLEQEINQYRKSHDELQKKGGSEWVGQLRHTVADLKAQLQAMP